MRGGTLQATFQDANIIYAIVPNISGYSIVAKIHQLLGDHDNLNVEWSPSVNSTIAYVRNVGSGFSASKTYNIGYIALYHKN